MSADNGIYILKTKDKFKNEGNGSFVNTFDKGVIAYRVAHAQAIDNLWWYEEKQPYNVGFFLDNVWGGCKVFYDREQAFNAAVELSKQYHILEYGINEIEREQYVFPGA